MKEQERYFSAIEHLCRRIKIPLSFLREEDIVKIREIRLRANKPLSLNADGENVFFADGRGLCKDKERAMTVQSEDIKESYKILVNSSVYSRIEEIKEGYLSMPFGNRAGLGCRVLSDGNITDISSINIRISSERKGFAEKLKRVYDGGGLLIAGAPGTGKTTLLRDFIRLFAQEENVTVIDSRNELSATYKGVSFNDLGSRSDIILTPFKGKGMEMAIRGLCPKLVAADEIGNREELEGIRQCLCAGAQIAVTAHINSKEELMKREITAELIKTQAVKYVAVLGENFSYDIFSSRQVRED